MAIAADRAAPRQQTRRFADDFDTQITREWLITNGRGGFASSTPVGIPTRRYHGLLVASARPPLERWMMLSAVLERISSNGRTWELASFEFDQAIHPQGYLLQTGFEVSNNPKSPWVRFEYKMDDLRVSKLLTLSRQADELTIAYRVDGPTGCELAFDLLSFVPMRDYHGTTHQFSGGFPVYQVNRHVVVEAYAGGPRLWMDLERADTGSPALFYPHTDWWRGFVYREELHRGFNDREDLFVPGHFHATGRSLVEVVFRASADFSGKPFDQMVPSKAFSVPAVGTAQQSVEERLVEAADAFVVSRRRPDGSDSTTVLAGYHWFGDWGRDTFIAMPGLLLETRRFAEARQVLETFASAQKDGLIPNRFSDYGDGCDYNSVDASMWYLHAATQYCRLSGDKTAWPDFLGHTCGQIIDGFLKGTQFNIFVDVDGLVNCGDATTQLTWMDAKYGDIVFTPRYGKPVEINALWFNGLMELSSLVEKRDAPLAGRYRSWAEKARLAFIEQFWNADLRYLHDVVRADFCDASIRPNQIFAVSLPHSPLNESQQQSVLACVGEHLFTPYGLRSLAPSDPRYRPRYAGNPFERDSAYHQGTVWGWLIGPYIEAYLRVHGFSAAAKTQARGMLSALAAHLDEAGIGSVSEVFDAEAPHNPGGCIAQAWSVSELLRAWRMTGK